MSVETMSSPDVLIPSDAAVGEGPVFDPKTGHLLWVDILRGAIHESDIASGATRTMTFDTLVGAVAPREAAEGFAVAVSEGFGIVSSGTLEIIDAVLPDPDHRMNDAKVDRLGRLWAGSAHMDYLPGEGALHRWDGIGPSEVMTSGLILPNGIGWTADDSLMFLVDSFAQTLFAASFDVDDGAVGEFHAVAQIDSGLPDGLAVDVDGCVWVAIWGGSEVRRYSPTGVLLARVPMPVSQPSSCAFSEDGTLVITSARTDLSDTQLLEEPHAGSVFALSTGTRGVPVSAFGA
ncbi:MAG: SMP-30/gluconolactonase/LRE family protein [Microbacteriaceae bacterium]|nr:SMP-30/gluconolactonase/LRE family protein [Microbacteriaceae bacterium]